MIPLHATLRATALKLIDQLARRHPVLVAEALAARLAKRPDVNAGAVFKRHGFHLLRDHYYLPIPDEAELTAEFWRQSSELCGVDMNEEVALGYLDDIFPRRVAEFRQRFPLAQGDPAEFFLINGGYMAVDAHVYFAFIREFKPRRIIEIGAGFSTMLAAAAGRMNAAEGGAPLHITAIEPYPWDIFRNGYPGVAELVAEKVQNVDRGLFMTLDRGDILFIDSSHVLRAGNDVQHEYLEILPRLRPGVLVHIHDISLPRPYPKVYFENQLYWNEQYLLQAFLVFNSRFEVIWPGNYMMEKYPHLMLQVFPEIEAMRQQYPSSEPTAFWIRSR
jgi:hypothetical protein